MTKVDAHLGAVERERGRVRHVDIQPSLGLACVKCGKPGTIALVRAVSMTINEIAGVLCPECEGLVAA